MLALSKTEAILGKKNTKDDKAFNDQIIGIHNKAADRFGERIDILEQRFNAGGMGQFANKQADMFSQLEELTTTVKDIKNLNDSNSQYPTPLNRAIELLSAKLNKIETKNRLAGGAIDTLSAADTSSNIGRSRPSGVLQNAGKNQIGKR